MRKVAALIIYVLIVIWISLISLYALSIRTWILDRDFYDRVLSNDGLYEDGIILNLFANGIATEITGEQRYGEIYPETVRAIAAGLEAVADEEYVRGQVNGAVDSILMYLDGETNQLQLNIDLLPIKQRLLGDVDGLAGEDSLAGEQAQIDFAETFARAYVEALRTCDADNPNDAPATSDIPLPDCRPDNKEVAVAIAEVQTKVAEFAGLAPDNFSTVLDISVQDLSRILKTVLSIGITAMVLLLVLNGLIAGGGLRGAVLWAGFGLLIPAMIVFGSGISVQIGATDEAVRNEINAQEVPELTLTEDFRVAMADAVLEAADEVAAGFLIVGTGALIIAIFGIGFGYVIPRPYKLE